VKRRMSQSKPPGQKPGAEKSVPKKLEEQLLKAGSRMFLTQFPNPKEQGCPDGKFLKALAWRRPFPKAPEVVEHLTACSPCSQKHRRHLRDYRTFKTTQRIAAVVLLTLGATWLWLRFFNISEKKQIPDIIRKAPVVTPPPPRQVEPREIALDLRNRSYTRGENVPPKSGTEKNGLQLPREQLRVKVHLPLGSEAGKYDVQIRKKSEPILRISGRARVQGGVTTLEFEADLSSFAPGSYFLAVRPPDSVVWRIYSIVVP
jgi:hypothetical protein